MMVAMFFETSIDSESSLLARTIWFSLSAGIRATPSSRTSTSATPRSRPISVSVAEIKRRPSFASSLRQSSTGAGVRLMTTLPAMARASARASRLQTSFMFRSRLGGGRPQQDGRRLSGWSSLAGICRSGRAEDSISIEVLPHTKTASRRESADTKCSGSFQNSGISP